MSSPSEGVGDARFSGHEPTVVVFEFLVRGAQAVEDNLRLLLWFWRIRKWGLSVITLTMFRRTSRLHAP